MQVTMLRSITFPIPQIFVRVRCAMRCDKPSTHLCKSSLHWDIYNLLSDSSKSSIDRIFVAFYSLKSRSPLRLPIFCLFHFRNNFKKSNYTSTCNLFSKFLRKLNPQKNRRKIEIIIWWQAFQNYSSKVLQI